MLMHATNRIPSEASAVEVAFADAQTLDERAKTAVAAAQKAGIIAEDADGNFKPNEDISWGEAIDMIVKEQQWPLVNVTTPHTKLDEQEQRTLLTAIEHKLLTVPVDDFAKMKDEPVVLGDVMLLMIEIMKGGDEK